MSENNSLNKSKNNNSEKSASQIVTRAQTKKLEQVGASTSQQIGQTTPEPTRQSTADLVRRATEVNERLKQCIPTVIKALKPTRRYKKMENIMSTFQIQQLIATAIPEFSGEDDGKRSANLTRFVATANSIFNSLQHEEEKNTFNRLIKLRLTDEAFMRITDRNLNTYPEIKTLLIEMYGETKSLNEWEDDYQNIKQNYGESVRNYGYRLLGALEKYKKMFKQKYSIAEIEATYNKHLQTNSIKVFKRGLNNTILKDKITTSTADNIEKIVNEAEQIERMLSDTNTPSEEKKAPSPNASLQETEQLQKIICNYCQKPNHTYDKCITRMRTEAVQKVNTQYRPNRFNQQQQNFQEQSPLYCSFCKTTKSHTFEQCRNKLKPQTNYQQRSFPLRQNYNQNQHQQRNNYQNNYQPQYNQGRQQNNYSNYNQRQYNQGQQRNYNYPQRNSDSQNQHQNYTNNNTPNRNHQTPNGNHTGQIFQPAHTNDQNITQELSNMLSKMKINSMYPGQEQVIQNMNQENSDGSNQN